MIHSNVTEHVVKKIESKNLAVNPLTMKRIIVFFAINSRLRSHFGSSMTAQAAYAEKVMQLTLLHILLLSSTQ